MRSTIAGMPSMSEREIYLVSDKLPGKTFARAVFDSQLVRLSDKAEASHLIGEAWSDLAATEVEEWVGGEIPISRNDVANGIVSDVHRLDTLPGVAARASKLGLKNPDFLVLICGAQGSTVVAVDAKFSIETARDDQVSAEATSKLFEEDEILGSLLPKLDRAHTFARGLFVSPDYSLTRAMFRQRMGHRRMTVRQGDVVLVDVDGAEMFAGLGTTEIMRRLISLDALEMSVWDSLLAGQYYFRLSRAMHGCALDEQRPLLGQCQVREDGAYVLDRIGQRSPACDSAWEVLLTWDRDVEHLRRQRQALHQVVGMPVSNAELRDVSDAVLVGLEPGLRPSRNKVRKALGGMYTSDVLEQTGVIIPPIEEFSAELERVASISRSVAEQYQSDIGTVVREIVESLVAEQVSPDTA